MFSGAETIIAFLEKGQGDSTFSKVPIPDLVGIGTVACGYPDGVVGLRKELSDLTSFITSLVEVKSKYYYMCSSECKLCQQGKEFAELKYML